MREQYQADKASKRRKSFHHCSKPVNTKDTHGISLLNIILGFIINKSLKRMIFLGFSEI